MKENPKGMGKSKQIENLNDMKVFSIEIQKYIHSACGNMANLLKMLDLKLKEIKIINQKIGTLASGKALKKISKKKISAAKVKAAKLKKVLAKEQLIIQRVMKEIQNKQKNIMKIMSVYNPKMMKGKNGQKNQSNIKNILTSLNLKLRSFMHLPYFKEAYKNFIGSVIASSKGFNPKQLKDYHTTAKVLIAKYWKKYLDNAKKEYKKKNKSHKVHKSRKGKKSSIKRMKH